MNKFINILLLVLIVEIYSTGVGNPLPICDATCASSCNEDKEFKNSRCYTRANVVNCKTYNGNADACYECKDNYEFDENICKVANCKTYDNDNDVCSECKPGFTKKSDGTACTCSGVIDEGICKTIANCVEYNTDDASCSECKPGFYRSDSNKKCTACGANKYSLGTETALASCFNEISGCVNYDNDDKTKCKACKVGKYLMSTTEGTTTTYSCVDCTSSEGVKVGDECILGLTNEPSETTNVKTGCEKYSDNDCKKCSDDNLYLIMDNECGACYSPKTSFNGKYCYTPSKIQNCYYFDYSEDKCKGCNSGYTLSDDICVSENQCETNPTNPTNPENAKKSTDVNNGSSSLKLSTMFMFLMLVVFW